VFCPRKQDIVLLTEPEPSVNVDDMPFIGAPVETELARSIAAGDINPITKERIVVPRSPGKRRISQALAPASGPPRSLGKPISEYFKDRAARRIPLGEMDPNCFAIEPDNNISATAEEAPRPIVFPLPRPYVEGVDEAAASPARPYTNKARVLRRQSEPISKILGLDFGENRRRTAGPAIQVYQDPTSSNRPPKKARLCEDAAFEEVTSATPEKSKFFSSTKQKKPAKKKVDELWMSDDSIEEAFRSLPDFDSWRPVKPAEPVEPVDGIAIFQELSPEKPKAPVLPIQPATDDRGTDDRDAIEVPASSPTQHGPAKERNPAPSLTPLGDLLREFSYDSARPRTRVVHGLPTPASSLQQTATPKSTRPANAPTPMLTPLQRIGARAVQRGKPRATSSTPPTPLSSNPSKQFDRFPINPAFVPLPKVDVEEVEALNRPLGSEDQMIPESDGENEMGVDESLASTSGRRFDLSKFLYS